MQITSKLWESKVLIRFPDCDPFNHLNNARYIDYFINAREDHVMAKFSISFMSSINFEHHPQFLQPLFLEWQHKL